MNVEFVSMMIAMVTILLTVVGGFVGFGVNFGSRLGKLEGIVSDLVSRFVHLENDVSGIKAEVSEMNVRLSVVESRMGTVESNVSLLMTQKISFSNSPRKLSDTGERLLDSINGRSLADGDYTNLKAQSLVNGDSKLDIQEGAKKAVEVLYTSGKLNEFEDEIFRTGKTLNDVFDALGLYLRDKIFREKGLRLDE
ncbi:hypothetical protein FACS1894125_7500 [Actinomycetota bacterium]|nr:hypothetical protein FACS1894125_7500 [Actinomycetota bacterium]